MHKYFFILGRNRALSLAEIFSVFHKHKILDYKPLYLEKEVLVVETAQKANLAELNKDFGGVVKCGSIVIEKEKGANLEVSLKEILTAENILKDFIGDSTKKVMLGFSLFVQKGKIFNVVKNLLKNLFISLKKELKSQGIKCRIVTSSSVTLSSVVIKKNKLIEQGSELNFFIFGSKILVGRTQFLQDFESFGFRDYQRPARDMEIGMMPPKLARMMVNISGAGKNDVLLDPFCGCGTILQEALLLGIGEVIGSDVNPKAVNKTRANIKWLEEKYNLKNKKTRIIVSDISEISQKIKNIIDVIVTEPYLGPILKKNMGFKEVRKITDQLIHQYRNFFREIRKIIRPRAKIVMIWPVFKGQKGFFNLPILEEVLKMGYKQEKILPEILKNKPFSEVTRRGSVIYSRKDQNVLREIFIFNYE